jgi:hypothetical protein
MAVVVPCFLVTAAGHAQRRSAALNLRIGSLYELSVALVIVRCESSQSYRSAFGDRSHDIAHLIAGFGCRLVVPMDPLNRESKSGYEHGYFHSQCSGFVTG